MGRLAFFILSFVVAAIAAGAPALLYGAPQTFVPRLAITTPSLPSAVVNTEYSAIVLATGGLAPYSFSVVSGSLPAGLSLDGGTGTVRGRPTATGSSNVTIQVVDTENPQMVATQNMEITVVMG